MAIAHQLLKRWAYEGVKFEDREAGHMLEELLSSKAWRNAGKQLNLANRTGGSRSALRAKKERIG